MVIRIQYLMMYSACVVRVSHPRLMDTVWTVRQSTCKMGCVWAYVARKCTSFRTVRRSALTNVWARMGCTRSKMLFSAGCVALHLINTRIDSAITAWKRVYFTAQRPKYAKVWALQCVFCTESRMGRRCVRWNAPQRRPRWTKNAKSLPVTLKFGSELESAPR